MKLEKFEPGMKKQADVQNLRTGVSSKQVDIKLEEKMNMNMNMNKIIGGVFVIIVLLGVTTGYVLARQLTNSGIIAIGADQTGPIKPGMTFGSPDTATFSDWAEGVIEKGGIKGEGTHALAREGGPSQTAYLISSVVDLDVFVSKKVKVWGKTVDAVYAPWLMDVGRLEILSE